MSEVALLASRLSYRLVTMDELRTMDPDFGLISFPECARRKLLFVRSDSELLLVIADPFDLSNREFAQGKSPEFEWALCQSGDLAAFLAMQEDKLKALDESHFTWASESQRDASIEDLSLSSIASDTSPAVRVVNSTIYDAMATGASDIHFETLSNGLQVKYRVDGVLLNASRISDRNLAERVVSRIKVMSELDISERRIPQDGRFKLSVRSHETDFRVSVMPSVHGEDVVIRVLDKRGLTDGLESLRLERLGFDEQSLRHIRRLASEPYGMLLVTGPTGSGKTTTLYAALSEINSGLEKIITIEDPVEYQLQGILQIPVNEKKGLTFARGLRSILRHDPDKILVGEIRDSETAEIAVQSALTGHLVFTSVHANNVFDVIGRFQHMGVDPHSFVAALNGIVAQRLIRTNCSSCSTITDYSEIDLLSLGLKKESDRDPRMMRGQGCGQCRGTGYRGRVAISEILIIDDELRELIVERSSIRELKATASEKGTRLLRQSAVDLFLSGRTTVEEVNRVTVAS